MELPDLIKALETQEGVARVDVEPEYNNYGILIRADVRYAPINPHFNKEDLESFFQETTPRGIRQIGPYRVTEQGMTIGRAIYHGEEVKVDGKHSFKPPFHVSAYPNETSLELLKRKCISGYGGNNYISTEGMKALRIFSGFSHQSIKKPRSEVPKQFT